MSFIFQFQKIAPFKNQGEVIACYENLIKGLDAMHEHHKNDNVIEFKKKNENRNR